MGLVVDGDGGRAGGSHCVQNSEGRRSGGDTRESVGLGLGFGLGWVGFGRLPVAVLSFAMNE